MPKQIVMIGTATDTRGGIASVIKVYRMQGLFERWPAVYLATHRNGSKLQKLATAASAWLRFLGLLASGQALLLHVHTASGASFWRKALFVVPALAARVPVVLHVHGGGFEQFFERQSPLLGRRFIRWVFLRSQAVVALSDEWMRSLASMAPGSRIVVVPNPIEIPPWQASLTGAPPTVLFLGLLLPAKGVQELICAWPAVTAAVPGAQLVLGGVGDQLPRWQELARSLGAEQSIRFAGWVLDDAKTELLKQAWVFALPSYLEALPMSILESMAAGIPVVATRVGGVPLAVAEGRTGHLVEPQDVAALAAALIDLLTDEDKRLSFGRQARQRAASEFSADVMVPKIDALWRAILPPAPEAPDAPDASAAAAP